MSVILTLVCLGSWLDWVAIARANTIEKTGMLSDHLRCSLTDSDDEFWFYPEQLIYRSDQFLLFQNFAGRVVTQIDLETGQFYRTTVIGEPFQSQRLPDELHIGSSPQKVQSLTGQCKGLENTGQWTVSSTPDNLY